MYQHHLKGSIYSQISGIDVIRDSKGEFYVLEDNLRTPSGVSYMLECRKISQKLMPKVFEQSNIAGIEQYPKLLREILAENAYTDNPFIVVLTPGRFNSAYYEHACLARDMDVPLVGVNRLMLVIEGSTTPILIHCALNQIVLWVFRA